MSRKDLTAGKRALIRAQWRAVRSIATSSHRSASELCDRLLQALSQRGHAIEGLRATRLEVRWEQLLRCDWPSAHGIRASEPWANPVCV